MNILSTTTGFVTGTILGATANLGGSWVGDTVALIISPSPSVRRTFSIWGVLGAGVLLSSTRDDSDFSKGMQAACFVTSIFTVVLHLNNSRLTPKYALAGLGIGALGTMVINPGAGIVLGGVAAVYLHNTEHQAAKAHTS